jgi:hypothetical protein
MQPEAPSARICPEICSASPGRQAKLTAMSHLTSASSLIFVLALAGCGESMPTPLGTGSAGGTPGGATGGATGQGGWAANSAGGASSSNTGGSTTTGTGGSLASDCGTTTGQGNITSQGSIVKVTQDGLEYVVQNNIWSTTGVTQKLWAEGTSFVVTEQSGDNSGSNTPLSYPSIFIGSNYNHASANSGLPRAVSSLGPITTRMTHNANGSVPGIYNASYDVWFSTTSAGDASGPSGGFLMVWLWDPSQKQPIGSRQAAGVTISGADGAWDVWVGTNGGRPCISYVRTQAISSLTFDLNQFIRDAVNRGSIQNSWYLSNVFGGFEIWSGGVGLNLQCFYVHMA